MPVVVQNSYILSDSGTFSEINTFSPDYEIKKILTVDVAVQYECPHRMMTYILVIRYALHVTTMTNILTPPFMMRETVIMVYDTPKIQVENPTVEDHSNYFQETGLGASSHNS